ncbi:SIMPL domain-containing protein [Paracoccus sediminicola]|uniref:SIMPL domain-containing protein n=1 Tax=Paracoccus sediminicola TaxID=3017783 RepID=UPI0022F078EE|nr:SIMPL domain-containing protein [Paracoccus sediminicola]WBU58246.1 SIMPL domain-containing protein [Paracoccus sediminicola]
MPAPRSNRLIAALLGGTCAALLTAPAMAAPGMGQSCGHPGMLTVAGHGEARVAPDQVMISLGVTTQAETADAAMQQNSQQQDAVLRSLSDAGVESPDIQTSGLTLNPMMNYPEGGAAPSIEGYMAHNMLTVRVTDIGRVGEVLDSIVDAGANEMQGIRFIREDSQATEDEALSLAVEDATHRAGVMADAAGLELGRLMRMGEPRAEIASPGPMAMRAMDAAGAQSNSIPVEGGEVAFTSEVELTFALASGEDCAMPGGKDRDHGDKHGERDRGDKNPEEDRGDRDRGDEARGSDRPRDMPSGPAPTESPDAPPAPSGQDGAGDDVTSDPMPLPATEATAAPDADEAETPPDASPAQGTAPSGDAEEPSASGTESDTASEDPTGEASEAEAEAEIEAATDVSTETLPNPDDIEMDAASDASTDAESPTSSN